MNGNVLAEGEILGPYRVVRLIGTGGMGEVYLALEERLNRKVALKIISAAMAADPQVLQRFQTEGRALALISQRNIVAVFGIDSCAQGHYIAMEYIDGRPLSAICKNAVLPANEAVPIFLQLVDGVQALHDKGVIHRDLKPSNIIYQKDSVIKILDLGIAKVYSDQNAQSTRTGLVIGTIQYIAPEIIAGHHAHPASDIWSLGAIFYELLTGQPLVKSGNHLQAFAQLAQLKVEFPPDCESWIPREMQSLIKRMCAKEISHRINDARIIRAELKAFALKYPDLGKWTYPFWAREIKSAAAIRQRLVQSGMSEMAAKRVLFDALSADDSLKEPTDDSTRVLGIEMGEQVLTDESLNSAIRNYTTKGFQIPIYQKLTLRSAWFGSAVIAFGLASYILLPKTNRQMASPPQVAAEVNTAPLAVREPKRPREEIVLGPVPEPVRQTAPAPAPAPAPERAAAPTPVVGNSSTNPRIVKTDFRKNTARLTTPKVISVLEPLVPYGRMLKNAPSLAWIKIAGARTYEIQISRNDDFSKIIFESKVSQNNFRWVDALPGEFAWRVRGQNKDGEFSAYSDVGRLEMRVAPPQFASDFNWESPAGQEGGKLVWQPSPFAQNYRVVVARDPAFTDRVENKIVVNPYADVRIPRAGSYYARVIALNNEEIEISVPSSAAKIVLKNLVLLDPPALVSPPENAKVISTSPLLVFWKANEKARNYELEVSADKDFAQIILAKQVTTNRHTLKSPAVRGFLFWRVRSVGADGKSSWSTRTFEVIP